MSSNLKRQKKDINLCTTCGRNIANERHIRCLKCSHFIQCLQCLSVGLEKKNHSRTHNFFVIEPRPFAIYCQNWDAYDEMLLLFGIKFLGIGNWNAIANFMKSKTAADIETHYTAVYINSPLAPFPVRDVLPPIPRPPPPPYDTQPIESCPSESHEKHMMEKNKKEKTMPAEFNGYMPYRHEFETDYNNEAEMLVAKLEFKPDEEFSNFYTKLSALVVYNSQLAERRFRTKVVEEWGILYKEEKFSKNDNNNYYMAYNSNNNSSSNLLSSGSSSNISMSMSSGSIGIGSEMGNSNDIDPYLLSGYSPSEKKVDRIIISLAPYLGYDKTQLLAKNLHKQLKYKENIRQRQLWQLNGIRSHAEGTLLTALQNCIKDGKMEITEIDNWNEYIEKYKRQTQNVSEKNDALLLPDEAQLCTQENIHTQLYLSIKCLLIRENACRLAFPKKDALAMDPHHVHQISSIYDLLVSLGMLKV